MRRTVCVGPCAGLCREDGFAAAYRTHRPTLMSRARAMLADRELAEDAVQEVFVRAWGACGSFDPSAGPPLVAWLSAITRNVVIDMARARAVRPALSWTAAADPEESSTAATDSVVLRMLLLDALSDLSADHRSVILRTVVRDRCHADVAAELDLPLGTVKSRTFYALRGMRNRLDHSEAVTR